MIFYVAFMRAKMIDTEVTVSEQAVVILGRPVEWALLACSQMGEVF